MGSFDTVKVLTADPRVACAHGHLLVAEFQTKNLGCAMATYYLVNGVLCAAGPQEEQEQEQERVVRDNDRIVLRSDLDLLPVLDAKAFELYTHCRHCTPIYTRSEQENWVTGSFLHPYFPWVSLQLTTERGTGKVLTVTAGAGHQTRDALRAQLAKGGSALVADDDPSVLVLVKP